MKQYLLWAIVLVTLAAVPIAPKSATISVGSKKFTESVILGEVLRLLAEDAQVTMSLQELGGTQILYEALRSGQILAYVEYTGTIDQEIFADRKIDSAAQRGRALAADGVASSRPLGFSNSYALAMRRDRASELGISRISDLSRHPQLGFGFSNEFIDRADGWPGLQATYRLPQRNVVGIDHDLAYRQLKAGEIDVIDAYTTDARIGPYDLVLLDDDENYFPRYEAVILYADKLAKGEPKLIGAWRGLEGQLDEQSMRQLNADVEINLIDESQTAARFLRDRFNILIETPPESQVQRIARHTGEHLDLVRRSLLPAILVAVPLGVIASKFRWLGQFVLAVTGIVQTIPALALLVLLMPVANWLGAPSIGRGSATAVMALFLYSLLPVVRNTVAGLQGIPASITESAKALGLAGFWRLNYVELPLATRTILAGIKTAAVLNIGYATLGALIGAGGLGQPILTGIRLNRFSLILEGAVPAAVLALVVQGGFEILERWAIPRGLRSPGQP